VGSTPTASTIYGGVKVSTGMTMMESRLFGEATSQKLQTNNWKQL